MNTLHQWIEALGQRFIDALEDLGRMGQLAFAASVLAFKPPFRPKELLISMEDVGVGSLFIVVLTGFFAGAVFSLQSVQGFRMFGAESMVGTTVALTLTRELGPVLTGLMVAGRSGSAMATTIGTMRVTEQVSAMEVMAVDPVHYLITPRVVATTTMLPLLNCLFVLVGMVGAYAVAVVMLDVDPGMFMGNIGLIVDPMDLIKGCIKAGAIGFAIATISCHKGFHAAGGAQGVGEATTSAVVLSSVTILVINYFLTAIMFT